MIKSRLFIILTLVLMGLLWTFFWFTEQQRSDSIIRGLLTTQVEALERELDQLSFVPKILSNEPTVVQAALEAMEDDSTQQQLFLNRASVRLQETQVASGLEFSFLLDRNGVTIAASNWKDEVSFIGQSYSFRPYFKQAILGETSTYYAIGATTGIPGYFIAEPVISKGETVGVVVVKLSLSGVAKSWGSQDTITSVVDEFGVVVLSSKQQYLYQPTLEIDGEVVDKLKSERRYGPFLPTSSNGFSSPRLDFTPYRRQEREIKQSPWKMVVLLPNSLILKRTLYQSVAAFSVLLIAWLLYSLYRQQRLTVAAEQRVSRELEVQVQERTAELEKIQKTLISESNFAMLGRMSAAINHEVNQPLATLRLNLASLRALFDEPSMSKESWGSVQQIVTDSDLTTKRIARVITSLRSYARQNRVNPQHINVAELIKEVRTTIDTERPNMSALIQYSIDEGLQPIRGDSTLLQQAILNLLYNAFDAVLGVDNPKVMIGATTEQSLPSSIQVEEGGDIIISVSDNGAGISASIRESLFDPFTSDSLDRGGLGLGLTITQQVIESHDGTLDCETGSHGSRFIIRVPSVGDAEIEKNFE